MRIETLAHALPRRAITTEWIVKKLRRVNAQHLSSAELADLEQLVVGFLDAAGSDLKYQTAEGESSLDVVVTACRKALEQAQWAPETIDLLLCASVARGCLEPATANFVQARAGLTAATCFDVLDGCAGWLRALEVVHAYQASGHYRRAMIVTGEVGFEPFGRWEFGGVRDLSDYLATFTIGEAATATLVEATDNDDFKVRFANYGVHADLCMIPLVTAGHFGLEAALERPADKFYAKSRELLGESTARIVEVFRGDPRFCEASYDIGFGHAASERAVEVIRRELNIDRKVYFPTHASYGNTVSSSVPLGMSLALSERRLARGQKVLVIVGASGISVGIASFTF